MINIKFYPNTYTVDIDGHAKMGEKGKDIVCAAISALFYTLAESLYQAKDMLSEDIEFSNEDGNGHISVKPKVEYEANVSLIYWTILNGFRMVEENYQKNVKLSVIES